MPNWCENKFTITGKIEKIRDFLKVGVGELNDVSNYGKISLHNASLSTYVPMPEIFSNFDTTNHPDKYPDIVKEQMETYGVVGWYAWSCKYWVQNGMLDLKQ